MAQDTRFSLTITPQACILAAFMLILVPLPWGASWILAALVHEFCHAAAVVVCGRQIYALQIDMCGAKIQTEAMSEPEGILCALAGPVGGLILIFMASMFPRLAVCALLQSAYNLLPVYPLDGGRAILSITRLFLQEKTAWIICVAVRMIVLISFCMFGVFAAFAWKLGLLPLMFALLFTIRMVKVKIPCK